MTLITPTRPEWFGEPRAKIIRAQGAERKPYKKQGQEEEWEAQLRYEAPAPIEGARIRERPCLTPEEVDAFIRKHRWTFAKTMPHIPHEYVVKQKLPDPLEFERFVLYIRRNGYRWKWRTRWGLYLDWPVNGVVHQFWTMGFPIEITKIINRAVKEHD